jgi:chemotaxis protein methyltransferase CheR
VYGYILHKMRRTGITDNELQLLLASIRKQYGYDFSDYAQASLKRRVNIFFRARFNNEYQLLYEFVKHDPQVFAALLQTITVNVTEMFRDPLFYKALREKVLPELSTYPHLKVWHAGCSTGEEVYSTAIVLKEAGLLERTRIYATDINASVLEKAKQGVVPLRSMKEYTQNYLASGGTQMFSSYYRAQKDEAVFDASLKKNMVFALHNLAADQSFNEFNLIICRNVLIYFNKELQAKVIDLFHQSLCSLCYLALGTKESLLFSDVKKHYEPVDANMKIFKRIK